MKKYCWLVKQSKKGWRIYFCLGEKLTFPVKGLIITDEKLIEKYLGGNIVYVHMDEKWVREMGEK